MKKVFAFLCAVVMVFGLGFSLAEEAKYTIEIGQQAPDFNVTMTVPEGYLSTQNYYDGVIYTTLYSKSDEDINSNQNTLFIVSVAYSEIYNGETVQTLSDEEKANFIDVMGMEMNSPVFSQTETSHGTSVFFLHETTEDPSLDYAVGMSVYQGYLVNMYVFPGEGKLLTDDDMKLAVDILSETWFTSVE